MRFWILFSLPFVQQAISLLRCSTRASGCLCSASHWAHWQHSCKSRAVPHSHCILAGEWGDSLAAPSTPTDTFLGNEAPTGTESLLPSGDITSALCWAPLPPGREEERLIHSAFCCKMELEAPVSLQTPGKGQGSWSQTIPIFYHLVPLLWWQVRVKASLVPIPSLIFVGKEKVPLLS